MIYEWEREVRRHATAGEKKARDPRFITTRAKRATKYVCSDNTLNERKARTRTRERARVIARNDSRLSVTVDSVIKAPALFGISRAYRWGGGKLL